MADALLTLRSGARVEHEIEVRRSRFIAMAARVDDPVHARALIADVRRAHPAARHHCTAYLIGAPNPSAHTSDDGEPAGAAGPVMLEAIRAAGLANVLAVVTRYFGGVLLGASGLARAYSNAVSQALARAPLAELAEQTLFEASLEAALVGRMEAALRRGGVSVRAIEWGADPVRMELACDPGDRDRLVGLVGETSGGRAVLAERGSILVERAPSVASKQGF